MTTTKEKAAETMARAKLELEVLGKVLDALEPIESNAKRLRVLAAVSALYGFDGISERALEGATRLEGEEAREAQRASAEAHRVKTNEAAK